MAAGSDDVEQLLTPVASLHITPRMMQLRKRDASSPTGETPVAKKQRAKVESARGKSCASPPSVVLLASLELLVYHHTQDRG